MRVYDLHICTCNGHATFLFFHRPPISIFFCFNTILKKVTDEMKQYGESRRVQ